MPRAKATTALICVCQFCDIQFRVKACDVAQGAGRFCSPTCLFDDARRRSEQTLQRRFWDRVVQGASENACWLWTGACINGYGTITRAGVQQYVHRLAWELTDGPDHADLFVCHVCDTPQCVRNDDKGTYEVNGVLYPRRGHLWIGDHDANMADKFTKGRNSGGVWTGMSKPGILNGRARLAEVEVIEIRRRYAAGGITQQALADEHGVTGTQISAIISRKAWHHLDL